MSKVKIIAINSNPGILHASSEKRLEANTSVKNEDNNTMAVIGRDIVFHGTSGGLFINFDGGYKTDKGFTYTILLKGGFAELIFKGNRQDYGYGDIRQILDGIEISEKVEITSIVFARMAWPV